MYSEAQLAYKKTATLRTEKAAMDAQHPTDPNSPNTMTAPASVTGTASVTNSLGGITGQTEEDMMLTPPVPGPEKQARFLGETMILNCLRARNSIK